MVQALSIEGTAAGYEKLAVFDGVSLDVQPGEVFGLIGLNGVGKTTLIKTILTLVKPTAGRIEIFGKDNQAPGSRDQLAYLPEKFQPPQQLTGDEFLRFSLSFYGQPYSRDQAAAAADALGLSQGALADRVNVYSKGMAQKLGLLATFLTARPLLILDEPMSGLDPKARILFKKMVDDCRAENRAVFMSSHILADLDETCDRVGILHDGGLVFVGTPKALREKTNAPTLERAFLATIE
jgi:ABC-2 type transport system ATP-binding protein